MDVNPITIPGVEIQKNAGLAPALAAANTDAQSKANIYATQVLSAASAPIGVDPTGQPVYNKPMVDSALSHLDNNGIDTSTWSRDPAQLAQQVNAAKWAQSNFGALANFGVKNEANTLEAAKQLGNPGAANNQLATGGIGALSMPGTGGFKLPVLNRDGTPYVAPLTGSDQTNGDKSQKDDQVVTAPASKTPPAVPASTDNTQQGSIKAPLDKVTKDYQQAQAEQQQKLAASGQLSNKNVSTATAPTPAQTMINGQVVPPMPTVTPIPPYDPTKELRANYDTRVAQLRAQDADNLARWEKDPLVIASGAESKSSGEIAGTLPEKSAAAQELVSRIDKNLDSMQIINPDVPQSKWGLPADAKAYVSQNFGDQTSAQAYQGFSKVNKAQVLNGIQELVQSGSIRNSKALITLVGEVNAIDENASPDTRAQQIEQVRSEIHNLSTSAQNINSRLNGGVIKPYENIPTTGKALPSQSGQPAGEPLGTLKQWNGQNYVKFKAGTGQDTWRVAQ